MKIKIQTNYFCKSNHWSKRMLKIKKIVTKVIKINDLGFKNNNFYFVNLVFVDDKKIRNIVHQFQQKCAYCPPKKYSGSVLDGRDITSVILRDAMFKFFITANVKTRARRRFKEYKNQNKKISFNEVLKSLKNRDKSDRQRKYGPLKKTKDSILINSTKLSRRQCFLKIKAIMDRKLNN